MEERDRSVRRWLTCLKEASERREWGQVVEASEQYDIIIRQLRADASSEKTIFNFEEKTLLQQCRKLLQQLNEQVRDPSLLSMNCGSNSSKDPSLEVKHILQSLLDNKHANHPGMKIQAAPSVLDLSAQQGNLTITIEKIGLKEPEKLIQPFVTVSVRGGSGQCIEGPYDTDYSSQREESYIIFRTDIALHTPVNQLPQDSRLFFELKHYKPSKRSISVKCFSFLEFDELRKVGPVMLEIYKKPTDFTRQKLELLSKKKLYLHANLSFTN